MNNVWTIAKRDFKAYFTSPIAYIVMAAFMLIMGWMFYMTLAHYMQSLGYQQYGGRTVSISDGIIRPLYGNMNVILLFVVPFITMRLFAEEKKLHTLELLMTAPMSLTEIILGKFLSALLLVGIMLLLTVVYPLILIVGGNPEVGVIASSLLGTFLIAGCDLAVGVLFSATTENQIVAAVLTFITLLFLWLVNWASQMAGSFWSEVVTQLSLITHFNNFGQGLISTTDVFYYVSFIGLGLFLTHRVLDSYRWR